MDKPEPTDRDIIIYQAQVQSQTIATLSQALGIITGMLQMQHQYHGDEGEGEQANQPHTSPSISDKKEPSARPEFLKSYE
jgi:hypothetical protein